MSKSNVFLVAVLLIAAFVAGRVSKDQNVSAQYDYIDASKRFTPPNESRFQYTQSPDGKTLYKWNVRLDPAQLIDTYEADKR